MKQIILILLMLLVFLTVIGYNKDLNGVIIKNLDQPVLGKWDFLPKKQWELDNADKKILTKIPCIRIAENGFIYVMDGNINQIHVFTPEGKYKFSFAGKGEGPGEIMEASNFFLIKKNVIIMDRQKIHYFSTNGEYKKMIKTQERFLSYLFLNEKETIGIPFSALFIKDKTQKRPVYLYDLENRRKKKLFEIPLIKLLEYRKIRLVLSMPGIMNEDLLIAKGTKYYIYNYPDNNTFYKKDLSGTSIKVFNINRRLRKKISIKEKKIVLKKAIEKHNNIPKSIINKMVKQIPDQLPNHHYMYIDSLGFVYVLASNILNPAQLDVDVFSNKGKYIYKGQLRLQNDYSIKRLAIRDKNLITFIEDSEGELKLVKYTISVPYL